MVAGASGGGTGWPDDKVAAGLVAANWGSGAAGVVAAGGGTEEARVVAVEPAGGAGAIAGVAAMSGCG